MNNNQGMNNNQTINNVNSVPVGQQVTSTGVSNTTTVATQTVVNQQPVSTATPVATSNPLENTNASQVVQPKVKTKKPYLTVLLLLVISGLCFTIYYINNLHQQEIDKLNYECTPVSTTGETKELDLTSTIVQDLYSKVKTNIREDLANIELNDEMKLYLAYRQVPTGKVYSSNCNYYNDTKMYGYSCQESLEFTPTAFNEEDLLIEVKKLFGETTILNHDDIQLGNSCIGGYQYIADRGEYVEGECSQLATTTFKVDKTLEKATSTESTIVLYEKVKYYGAEGKELPEKLVSGTYKYTFRLDSNYNYAYISKELNS